MKRIFCLIFATVLLFWGTRSVSAEQSTKDLLGADFIDRLTFFGESTTSHLIQRSKVSGSQVWKNPSGTAKLDSTIANRPIRDPRSDRFLSPVELARRDHPEFIVLSFGLNGIMEFEKNTDDYLKKYQKLIDALAEASPSTQFIIQSVYPVADLLHQTDWQFSVSPSEINQKISHLNDCMSKHCQTLSNTDFIDTSVNLKDEKGFLIPSFTTDGIHLTERAYHEILAQFREYAKSLSAAE